MIPPAKQITSRRKPDIVPEGWHTRLEIQRAWGLSADYTGKLIKESHENGGCEMKKFSIHTKLRGLYPTPHYRFKS